MSCICFCRFLCTMSSCLTFQAELDAFVPNLSRCLSFKHQIYYMANGMRLYCGHEQLGRVSQDLFCKPHILDP